ncbi:MAG: A24 family peptidase C-terminal domain-containing protein, partial [Candidatus Hydrothermarchaeales archaeon]
FLAIFPFILLWGIYASVKKAKLKEFLEPLKKIDEAGINAAVFVAALLLSDILNVSPAFAIPLVIFSYKLKDRIKILLSLLVGIGFIYYRGDLFFVIKYFGALFVTIMLFKLLWNSMNIVRKEALHDLVKIQELKEGMILSEDIYIENDKIFSKGIKERVIKRGKGPAIEKQARGLTMEEIDKLRELHKQGKIEEISITKGIPFAPIVLVGLLISLTLGDLIMVVRHG